jgi:CRISPR-associated protein Cst1
MKHRVYLRDWYFNAGIIGFLATIADGSDFQALKNINGLIIDDMFIEFDDEVLDNFQDKFNKQAFLKFFNKQAYIVRIRKPLKDLNNNKKDPTRSKLKNYVKAIEKSPYLNFLELLGSPLGEPSNADELKDRINKAVDRIQSLSEEKIISLLLSTPEGKASFLNFIKVRLKGVCESKNIEKYIQKLKKTDYGKKIKLNDYCPSCQEKKSAFEFSNSISNAIGFNKDNSNWIWGYIATKMKVCPVCALIYSCAFVSFAYILRYVESNWLNHFYFINNNDNLKALYQSIELFKKSLTLDDDEPLFTMIKETVRLVNQAKSDKVSKNINFIELIDNPILKGQGSKGYNIYNYTIDLNTAAFLSPFLSDSKSMPSGYYKIKTTYYSITNELLENAVKRQIDYQLLYKYVSYYISESINTKYNLSKIINYIFIYIRKHAGGKMEKNETIIKKGFRNGIELRGRLKQSDNLNQINGIIYGFLNDLKIADREKFMDKYIRIMMSNKMPIFFGKDEMMNTDYFLQFGYSFINGLLRQEKKENNNKESMGEN